jgi:hypothetical protein
LHLLMIRLIATYFQTSWTLSWERHCLISWMMGGNGSRSRMCEFPFLQLRCKQRGPFSDAGNFITSKILRNRISKLAYYSINKRIGTKMKNTSCLLLVHSFSWFLAGGKALAD